MSKKVIIVFALAIVATLLFTACERSVSQSMLASPTAGSTVTASQAAELSLVQQWGTSTAVYVKTAEALGSITPTPTSETSLPSLTATLAGGATAVATLAGAPTSTPVVIAPTTIPGRPATYTIHSGEFPYCLARRFNVDPDDLMRLNGLSGGQDLQPGLTLSIPQTGSFPGARALNPHPDKWTVSVDDTFYSIACYYGDVDPTSIAAANGLSMTSSLTSGQVLSIP